MARCDRELSKGLLVIAGLSGLLFLAGIILLPGLGTYADEVQAQSEVEGAQPEVSHNTWTSGAALPTAVTLGAAAVLQNEIYVVGGNDAAGNSPSGVVADVQIYNPATNSWSAGVPYPTTIEAASAAVVKNVLYVFGGSPDAVNPTNAVWAYNPKAKSWSPMANMPTARWASEAVVEKTTNIIYVIGGDVNGSGNGNIATVESYNPATNTWTEDAPMLVAKGQSAAGLIGTTIVVADGFINGGGNTGDTEAYDAATNKWTGLAANPVGGRGAACWGSIGPKLYDVGGANQPTTTESFQLSKNKWTTGLGPIPQSIFFPASAVFKGRLFCFGGWPNWLGTPQNTVQVYQP